MKIEINSTADLIEFVNRPEVNILDAERIINKCFPSIIVIDFSEGNRILPTKKELIERIIEYSQPLPDLEIKIYWH